MRYTTPKIIPPRKIEGYFRDPFRLSIESASSGDYSSAESQSSTINAIIETKFNENKIKDVVDKLVMEKYGPEFDRRSAKLSSRRYKNSRRSSSDSNSSEEEPGNNYKTNCTAFISALCNGEALSSGSASLADLSDLISKSDPKSQMTAISNLIKNVSMYLNTYETTSENTHDVVPSTNSDGFVCRKHDPTCASVMTLSRTLIVLNQRRYEILKALYFLDVTQKNILSQERLEAEKILLITSMKYDLLVDESNKLLVENSNDIEPFSVGEVQVSNIRLWLDEVSSSDQYFLCVIICGTNIYTSEISKIKSNGVIYFNKNFILSSLKPDFKLSLKIYSVSSEILQQKTKNRRCFLSPRKQNQRSFHRKSLFTIWEQTEININHIQQSSRQFYLNCGCLTAYISCQAHIKINLSGLVNISETSTTYPLWNQQWCVLEGRIFKYFHYPPLISHETEPAGVFDLGNSEVRVLKREECPRKQTICLKDRTGKGILMSFDSHHEFDGWRKYLSIAIEQISEWEKR